MRLLAVMLLVGSCAATAQEASRPYDPKTSYSLFAEYSNDSSHILIGQTERRKLLGFGGSYNRRLISRGWYSWRYEAEVLPVVLVQNPREYIDATFNITGQPSDTSHTSDFVGKECVASTGSGLVYVGAGPGLPPVVTGSYSYAITCQHPWTYAGGLSPLGQKVNFFPRRRLQPYLAANGGFLASTRDIPVDQSEMFNFTFEVGGGVQWYAGARRAWAVDYRYHHLSNGYRGIQNPGIDNGVVRLTYTFGR
jgi:hypothetical protein